jgi:hypothetical protein
MLFIRPCQTFSFKKFEKILSEKTTP